MLSMAIPTNHPLFTVLQINGLADLSEWNPAISGRLARRLYAQISGHRRPSADNLKLTLDELRSHGCNVGRSGKSPSEHKRR